MDKEMKGQSIEEGRAAKTKVLIKNFKIFFLCPSKQFLPISFQIGIFSPKTEGTKT
jgi:hypothetical protein